VIISGYEKDISVTQQADVPHQASLLIHFISDDILQAELRKNRPVLHNLFFNFTIGCRNHFKQPEPHAWRRIQRSSINSRVSAVDLRRERDWLDGKGPYFLPTSAFCTSRSSARIVRPAKSPAWNCIGWPIVVESQWLRTRWSPINGM
jgi:hypothetical protein